MGGAEMPDAAQAITVARRGYGSMAIASCIGSQVINICCGLGLPWFIISLAKQKVTFASHSSFLEVAASCVLGAVAMQLVLLVVLALLMRSPKAIYTRKKAVVGITVYVAALIF